MRFQETQRFGGWVWVPMLGAVGVVWWAAYQQLIGNRPFGSEPAPDEVMAVIWLLVGVVLPALFGSSHLRTEVRNDGVHLRFFPFHFRGKHWRFDEIAEAYARDYSPIFEYGGWGIRFSFWGKGWAYSPRGSRGVQLVLHSGKRVLIGSQMPERLTMAIRDGMDRTARQTTAVR
jgi:hypothetical protein